MSDGKIIIAVILCVVGLTSYGIYDYLNNPCRHVCDRQMQYTYTTYVIVNKVSVPQQNIGYRCVEGHYVQNPRVAEICEKADPPKYDLR